MSTQLEKFVKTIARLRAPDGCPWDREQDHQSLARYLLEETYEVLEALHQENPRALKEELGDLLLQIVLHAQIAKDNHQFDIEDVAQAINEKMISRHPHVFGDRKVSDANEVKTNWEELKRQEISAKAGKVPSAMDGITSTLPALMQALKISERAVHQGFEWERIEDVWEKLYSELEELKEAMNSPDGDGRRRKIELELGDVLFNLVNLARWNNLNAEECLLLANQKFQMRFREMEKMSKVPLSSLNLKELDQLWEKSKLTVG